MIIEQNSYLHKFSYHQTNLIEHISRICNTFTFLICFVVQTWPNTQLSNNDGIVLLEKQYYKHVTPSQIYMIYFQEITKTHLINISAITVHEKEVNNQATTVNLHVFCKSRMVGHNSVQQFCHSLRILHRCAVHQITRQNSL